MSITQIINGTIKNILNKDEELFSERIKICRVCPLLKVDNIFGEVCNSSLYINPSTNQTSNLPLIGYVKGCGCILGSKTRVQEEHCPAKK